MNLVSFPKEFDRKFLDDLSRAIAEAVKPLGYALYDFGGKNYVAPVPGELLGPVTPVMFALEKDLTALTASQVVAYSLDTKTEQE